MYEVSRIENASYNKRYIFLSYGVRENKMFYVEAQKSIIKIRLKLGVLVTCKATIANYVRFQGDTGAYRRDSCAQVSKPVEDVVG